VRNIVASLLISLLSGMTGWGLISLLSGMTGWGHRHARPRLKDCGGDGDGDCGGDTFTVTPVFCQAGVRGYLFHNPSRVKSSITSTIDSRKTATKVSMFSRVRINGGDNTLRCAIGRTNTPRFWAAVAMRSPT